MNHDSPYRGLVPYTEKDAEWFFGRDPEREIIAANLLSSRLTLLYGTSGAGKSSVIRAGVINDLRRELQEAAELGDPPDYAVVYFKEWSGDPTTGLLTASNAAVSAMLGRQAAAPASTLAESFATWTRELGGTLLVILDQFEEFFTYDSQDAAAKDSTSAWSRFGADLARVINDESLHVSVLISMREDRLANLDRFKGSIPKLFTNYLRVNHLDRGDAREAIQKPLKRFEELHPATRVDIEPALVEEVLDAVAVGSDLLERQGRGSAEAEAATRVEAPYLQLVMKRLWREEVGSDAVSKKVIRLRLSTLKERLGGTKEIVRKHLDEVLMGLRQDDLDVAAEMFHYMVTPTGSKIAYSATDLAKSTECDKKAVERVLVALSSGENRILREVGDEGHAELKFEIFHDVLGQAILTWRANYKQRKQWAREADEAIERRRLKRRRTLQRVGTALAVLLLVSTVAYALVSRHQAALAAAALAKANEEAELAKRKAAEKEKEAEEGTQRLIELQMVVASKADALEKMQSTVAQTNESKKQLEELRAALAKAQLAAQQADKARRDAITSLKQSHYKDLSTIEGLRPETLESLKAESKKACFPAGTSIRTAFGVAPIERLAPGDVVLAVGPLGETVFTRVVRVFRTKAPLFIVRTTGGVLRATADHPLAVEWDRFVRAEELTLGAFLRRWPQDQQPAEVLQTEQLSEPLDVYNLEVGAPHTFIADGFVVHNKAGP